MSHILSGIFCEKAFVTSTGKLTSAFSKKSESFSQKITITFLVNSLVSQVS